MGTDSCVGEEKACLSSECGFSSPCHLKAFQLHVHIILNLIINSQEKEISDESKYKTSFQHCHLKKAMQWPPLFCPLGWDHIVLNFQEEIAIICVNTELKGWVFSSNLSLSLPPLPLSYQVQEQVYLTFRENSTDYLKIPAVIRRYKTRNAFWVRDWIEVALLTKTKVLWTM